MAVLAMVVLAVASAEPSLFDSEALDGSGNLRGLGSADPFAEDSSAQNRWLKDISTRTKDYFKKILSPLQTPIVQEYQVLTILEQYVNYTMDKVENATGSAVIWNRTSRSLMEALEDPDMQDPDMEEPLGAPERALSSRRRRQGSDLPPRARYINKILIYLNKEMLVGALIHMFH
eukprot:Skav202369  [mRNA]  locus=scaffold1406:67786:68310:+ [translate_table: standard]